MAEIKIFLPIYFFLLCIFQFTFSHVFPQSYANLFWREIQAWEDHME